MALEYRYQPRDAGTPVDAVEIEQHWYLTEDKDRVVPEGDPAARWLWATPGMDMPRAEAERLGAVKADAEADPDDGESEEPVSEAPPKERSAPPNKQQPKPGDKTAGQPVSVEDLRKQAAALGVSVDKRWGAPRLLEEIAAAEANAEG